jgi:MFS family permease
MRDVLRTPGALSLFATSCVARLPMGAVGLLLVLHTHELTGSYAAGGLASGVYALALGLSNPVLGRVVDRRGQTPVLRAGAPAAAAAIVFIALLPEGAPTGILIAGAAAAGAGQPPVGACMRALWPELLATADRRHAAYALEAAALEIVYICGPVVIVAGVGSLSLTAALLVCAGVLLVGDLAFSAHPVSRGWRPHAEPVRDITGALRAGGVRVLFAVFALIGLSIGAIEVAVPAMLDTMGHRELTGLLLGAWGVGSMLAGFAVGHLGAPSDATRRLAWLLAAWGAAHAAIGAAGAPVTLALALFVAGVTIAPTLVCANEMLDHLAPAGALTEAFTWTQTGIVIGVAVGSAAGGALVEATSPALAVAALSAGGVIAALLVRAAAAGPLAAPAPAPA